MLKRIKKTQKIKSFKVKRLQRKSKKQSTTENPSECNSNTQKANLISVSFLKKPGFSLPIILFCVERFEAIIHAFIQISLSCYITKKVAD